MDKRLEKRHKRQVARAKERVKVSEPDVRTPEELKAAREASRPASSRRTGTGSNLAPQNRRGHAGPSVESAAKGDT
jgi:hypothetical protein